ncbi:MAG: hypothetical protein ACREDO_06105 [Methyloceanibacter sp.]
MHYEANIAVESRPFPSAVEALERRAASGATLAVCTNQSEHISRRLLQALDLERYFSAEGRARHFRRLEARRGPPARARLNWPEALATPCWLETAASIS